MYSTIIRLSVVSLFQEPNAAHKAIAELEARLKPQGRKVTVVTQNIDRLHHRAGSQSVLELHGERQGPALKFRSCEWPGCTPASCPGFPPDFMHSLKLQDEIWDRGNLVQGYLYSTLANKVMLRSSLLDHPGRVDASLSSPGSLFHTRCTSCHHVEENYNSPICPALKDKGYAQLHLVFHRSL